MPHMVIFQRADGTAGNHQCDELNAAVEYVETIRNNEGVEHARIFRMEEVTFDFKPYFRVEVGGAATAPTAAPAPAAAAPTPPPPSAPAQTEYQDAPSFESGPFEPQPFDGPPAEAQEQVSDQFAAEPEAFPDPPSMPDPLAPLVSPDELVDESAGARRGLFGR